MALGPGRQSRVTPWVCIARGGTASTRVITRSGSGSRCGIRGLSAAAHSHAHHHGRDCRQQAGRRKGAGEHVGKTSSDAVVPPNQGQRCPNCGTPSIVPQPGAGAPIAALEHGSGNESGANPTWGRYLAGTIPDFRSSTRGRSPKVGSAAGSRNESARKRMGGGPQWLRRALMSSSLFMEERPSMPISAARLCRSSTVQSS